MDANIFILIEGNYLYNKCNINNGKCTRKYNCFYIRKKIFPYVGLSVYARDGEENLSHVES